MTRPRALPRFYTTVTRAPYTNLTNGNIILDCKRVLRKRYGFAPAIGQNINAVAIARRRRHHGARGIACPSAELIEPPAAALLAAVRDHFQQPHCRTSKAKAPRGGGQDGRECPERRAMAKSAAVSRRGTSPGCPPALRASSGLLHWTKLPMISTLDDICWKWSKRASSTSIVARLYRLAVVPVHVVQQWDRKVA